MLSFSLILSLSHPPSHPPTRHPTEKVFLSLSECFSFQLQPQLAPSYLVASLSCAEPGTAKPQLVFSSLIFLYFILISVLLAPCSTEPASCTSFFLCDSFLFLSNYFVAKLHSKLQTQFNFSWLEKDLTLFSHGRRRRRNKEQPSPTFKQK